MKQKLHWGNDPERIALSERQRELYALDRPLSDEEEREKRRIADAISHMASVTYYGDEMPHPNTQTIASIDYDGCEMAPDGTCFNLTVHLDCGHTMTVKRSKNPEKLVGKTRVCTTCERFSNGG